MTIYRADPKHGVAWVTGGSTGIGRALALELARAGYTVAITAPDQAGVDAVVTKAAGWSGQSGRVLAFAGDVTDEAGMAKLVERIEQEAGPIVLAVFNAGIYQPAAGEDLEPAVFRETFEVNFFGVLNGMIPTIRRMQDHGRGHVVVIGSVISFLGFPSAGAYGASKAALNNMAEALRYDFEKMNIRIQVVNPGFVYTPLVASNDFRTPGLMSVDKAVQRIIAGIVSGGFEVTFPRRLAWGLKMMRLLPKEIVFRYMTRRTRWRSRPLKPRAPRNG